MPGVFVSCLMFSGCADRVVSREPRDVLNHPMKSGNPVRDWIENDLAELKSFHAAKDRVQAKLGGHALPVPDATYLKKLPHAGESTVTVPPELLAEWKNLFRRSSETVYLMAEDGNDILLFFDSAGRLVEYVHM